MSTDKVKYQFIQKEIRGRPEHKGVTDFGHLRILENMLSEATKLRALCFLKLFLLVLMVRSENSRGHV